MPKTSAHVVPDNVTTKLLPDDAIRQCGAAMQAWHGSSLAVCCVVAATYLVGYHLQPANSPNHVTVDTLTDKLRALAKEISGTARSRVYDLVSTGHDLFVKIAKTHRFGDIVDTVATAPTIQDAASAIQAWLNPAGISNFDKLKEMLTGKSRRKRGNTVKPQDKAANAVTNALKGADDEAKTAIIAAVANTLPPVEIIMVEARRLDVDTLGRTIKAMESLLTEKLSEPVAGSKGKTPRQRKPKPEVQAEA